MAIKTKVSLTLAISIVTASSPVWAVGSKPLVNLAKKLNLSGVIELEASSVSGGSKKAVGAKAGMVEAGGSVTPRAEVGMLYQPTDKLDLNAVLSYEPGKLAVDEAAMTWHALPDGQLDIAAGKKYLPFGSSMVTSGKQYAPVGEVIESEMISDPLTTVLGETSQNKVLQVSSHSDNVHAAAYVFGGTSPQAQGTGKHGSGYGLSVGYGAGATNVGVDYLSNLAEARHFGKNLAEATYFNTNAVANKIPAVALHGSTTLGRVTVSAEHLAALKAFQPGDLDGAVKAAAKPAVTSLEADLDLQHERVIAAAWNRSSQAQDLVMPKESLGIAYRQPLYKDVNGGLEVMQTKGYDGEKYNAVTAQLSYEF